MTTTRPTQQRPSLTHPAGSAPLVRKLVTEWGSIAAQPRTLRTINRWDLPGGPIDHLDEVIKIIRESASPDIAKDELIVKFNLSEIQARAIVEMRLRQLTGLEQDKLRNELKELKDIIEHLKSILNSEEKILAIIKDELIEISKNYTDES